jgi:hypothetical protein
VEFEVSVAYGENQGKLFTRMLLLGGGRDFQNLYSGVLFHGMLILEVIFRNLKLVRRELKQLMILLKEMQLGLIVIDSSGNSLLL